MPRKLSSWQLLWRMLCYAPWLYALDSLCWILITGLPVVPGLIVREFFDTLTGNARFAVSSWVWIALIVAIGLARIIAIFLGRITKTQHRFLMSSLLRHNLLAQILQHPGAQPLISSGKNNAAVSPGELLSYFRDDAEQVEDNIAFISEITGVGLFATAALWLLITINAQITFFVFLPLVIMALIVQQAQRRIKRYRQASRQATQQVTGLINEMFNSVQAIQVAGAETAVLNHFRQVNEQRRRLMLKDQVFTAVLDSAFQNLVNIGTGLVLLLASQAMSRGAALTVGDFALFVYALSYVTEFMTFVGEFMAVSKQTEVSFERMTALLPSSLSNSQSAPLVMHHPLYVNNLQGLQPPLKPVVQPRREQNLHLEELKAINLTYCYPGTQKGIHGIDLQLKRGSFTVITGQIGSGKTTLVRVLLGLLPMQAGAIYWNGQRIQNPAEFFVPPCSAYTPQVPQLFSSTLRHNMLLGLAKEEADLSEAIALSVFERDLTAMPEKLETLIGSKGMRLSGGQLQRAAAARMFVRQPQLLVFDDLSSALDVETEKLLWSRLFAARSQPNSNAWLPTCLVVSHRRSVLQRADQIILLHEGKAIAAGTFADLRKTYFE